MGPQQGKHSVVDRRRKRPKREKKKKPPEEILVMRGTCAKRALRGFTLSKIKALSIGRNWEKRAEIQNKKEKKLLGTGPKEITSGT